MDGRTVVATQGGGYAAYDRENDRYEFVAFVPKGFSRGDFVDERWGLIPTGKTVDEVMQEEYAQTQEALHSAAKVLCSMVFDDTVTINTITEEGTRIELRFTNGLVNLIVDKDRAFTFEKPELVKTIRNMFTYDPDYFLDD